MTQRQQFPPQRERQIRERLVIAAETQQRIPVDPGEVSVTDWYVEDVACLLAVLDEEREDRKRAEAERDDARRELEDDHRTIDTLQTRSEALAAEQDALRRRAERAEGANAKVRATLTYAGVGVPYPNNRLPQLIEAHRITLRNPDNRDYWAHVQRQLEEADDLLAQEQAAPKDVPSASYIRSHGPASPPLTPEQLSGGTFVDKFRAQGQSPLLTAVENVLDEAFWHNPWDANHLRAIQDYREAVRRGVQSLYTGGAQGRVPGPLAELTEHFVEALEAVNQVAHDIQDWADQGKPPPDADVLETWAQRLGLTYDAVAGMRVSGRAQGQAPPTAVAEVLADIRRHIGPGPADVYDWPPTMDTVRRWATLLAQGQAAVSTGADLPTAEDLDMLASYLQCDEPKLARHGGPAGAAVLTGLRRKLANLAAAMRAQVQAPPVVTVPEDMAAELRRMANQAASLSARTFHAKDFDRAQKAQHLATRLWNLAKEAETVTVTDGAAALAGQKGDGT